MIDYPRPAHSPLPRGFEQGQSKGTRPLSSASPPVLGILVNKALLVLGATKNLSPHLTRLSALFSVRLEMTDTLPVSFNIHSTRLHLVRLK